MPLISPDLPPKPLKPCRIGRRVNDGVPDVAVSEVVLNKPRVRALVGQGEGADNVAQLLNVSRRTPYRAMAVP